MGHARAAGRPHRRRARMATGAPVVAIAWCLLALLGGCGGSDPPAPSAAARPPETEGNTNTVTIPPESPQARQMRVEPVRAADMPV